MVRRHGAHARQDMKVVIAGGTGFIGGKLAGRLAGRGDEVTILSRRRASSTSSASSPGSKTLTWNPLSGPVPRELLDDAAVVINLVGEPIIGRWTDEKKRRIRDSRVLGTRNVVAGIAAAPERPSVLINASATGYYGPHGDEEIDESAPPSEDFLGSTCREWEAEAFRVRDAGVRVAAIRTGVALGKEGGALRSMLLPFRLGLGGRLGSGRQWVPWIQIDDLCSLIAHVIERPGLDGPINGTAPHPVRNAEFTRALARALHRPAVFPVPAFALRLALGEVADALLTGQRVLPKRALESGFRFAHPQIDSALASVL